MASVLSNDVEFTTSPGSEVAEADGRAVDEREGVRVIAVDAVPDGVAVAPVVDVRERVEVGDPVIETDGVAVGAGVPVVEAESVAVVLIEDV